MGSLSQMLLASAGVIGLGFILHIVGLATPNWIESKEGDSSAGLWEYCVGSKCETHEDDDLKDDFKAVRAMIILGMLAGLVGLGAVLYMLIFNVMNKAVPSITSMVCLGSTIAAFVFIIIGVIVFGGKTYEGNEHIKENSDLAYSFALCIVGAILMPIGGALAYLGGGASVAVA